MNIESEKKFQAELQLALEQMVDKRNKSNPPMYPNCRCAVTEKSEFPGKELAGDIQFVGGENVITTTSDKGITITLSANADLPNRETYVPRHPEWAYKKFCGLFKFCDSPLIHRVYPSAHFFTRTPLLLNTITLDSHSLDTICEIFRNAERIEPMPKELLPKFKTQQPPEKIESYDIKFPLLAKYLG